MRPEHRRPRRATMGPSRALPLLFFLALAACESDDPLRPMAGGIRVTLTLEGLDLDPDGALIQLDGRVPLPLADGAALGLEAEPGTHRLLLSGLTNNCEVPAGESRLVEVEEGRMEPVVFTVRCVAASGVVLVYLVEQGTGSDRNGYLVSVDSGLPQRALNGGVAGFAPVAGGLHSITLSDIARSCTVLGDNPLRGVRVHAGTMVRDTVRATMRLECTAGSGSLELVTSTSGPPDPDGYIIAINAPPVQTFRVGANAAMTLTGLEVGQLPLSISDIDGNCNPVASPGSVAITAGDTARAFFQIECVVPAVLRVTAPTTGASLDPGYLVRVDGSAEAHALLASDRISLNLGPGNHQIALEDIAPNCTVATANPVTVQLSTTAPTDLAFPVTCSAISRTGIDLIVTTTGQDQPLGYTLTVCNSNDSECWSPVLNAAFVAATGTLQIEAPAGWYGTYLYNSAENCWMVAPIGWINVVAGQVTTARLDMTCAPLADFVATVTATGSDLPEGFSLTVNRAEKGYLPLSIPTRFSSYEGDQTLELTGMPVNCHPAGSYPPVVHLVAGVLTAVQFEVACEPYPVVQISVNSSGTNVPPGYIVIIDPDPIAGFHGFYSPITANGTITTKVYPGSHQVWLDQVPSSCSVSGSNPVSVNGGLGSTTQVTFGVTCH